MGFCILGGKENYLRKVISDKLTSLGQTINIGATATAFASAIQTMYDSRYTAGQDSLKTARKLTLTSSQTGNNINIADNWYTTCDASAVYTAGQNSVKTSRKLTLTASQTGSNVDIADNWYTTCDASAVYNKGKADSVTTQTGSFSLGHWYHACTIQFNAGNFNSISVTCTDSPAGDIETGDLYVQCGTNIQSFTGRNQTKTITGCKNKAIIIGCTAWHDRDSYGDFGGTYTLKT